MVYVSSTFKLHSWVNGAAVNCQLKPHLQKCIVLAKLVSVLFLCTEGTCPCSSSVAILVKHKNDQLKVKPVLVPLSYYATSPWAIQLSPNISNV